jgi:hypothetical protein
MSTTYGTQSAITIPSDGDTIDAADVNTPLAAVWDRHDFVDTLVALQAILVPTHGLVRYVRGYGHFVFVTSGTYSASTVASPWILTATDGTAGRWVMDLTAESNRTVITSFAPHLMGALTTNGTYTKAHDWSGTVLLVPTTAAPDASRYYNEGRQVKFYDVDAAAALVKHLLFPLNQYLVHGATLGSVKLILGGNGAHLGLPAVMPALGIVRHEPLADTTASLHSTTPMKDDASASAAAFDAIHSITFTPDQNNEIDLTQYSYYAVVCNEGHTNALAELRLRQLIITMTAKGFF